MAIEHPDPSPATVKELYANAYRCAFPGCRRPLYKIDPETGLRTLNSRVAHICARREGGPRWNQTQTREENRSVANLLLLCIEHSYEIDDPGRLEDFSVEDLRKWKLQQLAEFDALGQGWILSEEEAEDAAKTSFRSPSIQVINSVVSLGGEGGKAPAAGGGGGAAVGLGACGGYGGPGGNIQLDGQSGEAPGAGGGGAGAIGEGASGGEGGQGGEYVVGVFRAEDLPPTIDIKIGRGGRGGENGADGEDGEDTCFGDLLHAKGGRGGRAGSLQPSARQVVDADLEKELHVSSVLLADCVHIRNGLLYLLSAGWEHYEVPSLPIEVQWPLACVVSMGELEPETLLELFAVVTDPTGAQVMQQSFTLSRGDPRSVARPHALTTLRFTASGAGVWSIKIVSGSVELARLPIEIRLRSQQS